MTEQRTIPAYGVSIAIEDATVSLYLRETALDAIAEQVTEDLDSAMRDLREGDVLYEPEALLTLRNDLHAAYELAANAWEIAVAMEPEPDA